MPNTNNNSVIELIYYILKILAMKKNDHNTDGSRIFEFADIQL